MSKVKIKLKLQGFELEVEGDRQDVAVATRGISNQLSALMMPPNHVVSGGNGIGQLIDVTPEPLPEERRPARRKTGAAARGGSSNKLDAAIDFINDPARFGTPSQSWNLTQKAM